jgi:hypothetical protein
VSDTGRLAGMGYSLVDVNALEGGGVRRPVVDPDGVTMIAVVARRGGNEPHGPF